MSRISVIIPVLNEQAIIAHSIERCRAALGEELHEIIVVDTNGRSLAALNNAPDIIKLTAPLGRGRQLAVGAHVASAPHLLFLHADSYLPAQSGRAITAALERSNTVGAFSLKIDAGGRWSIYRLMEASITLRSRLFKSPYGDQGFFMRRECYNASGGFAAVNFLEDLDLISRCKRQGTTITVLKQRITTSARRWQSEGWLKRTLLNWIILTLWHLKVPPSRLTGLYRTQQ